MADKKSVFEIENMCPKTVAIAKVFTYKFGISTLELI